jgi:hypothetical protein
MMLKLAVLIAGMFTALAYQYPEFAKSTKQAVQLEMSHFFPQPRR